MTAEVQEKVEHLVSLIGANGYKPGHEWNGYEVYEFVFLRHSCVGGPWMILVNGDDVRVCTREEGFEYLKYKIALEGESKKAG
ncbi:MAG: hypothetical protein LUE27_01155 [Clostridia bacterium]|nr:hypothetical protein [Clostridia bacterium]